MRILVTGYAGFIGSNLVRRLGAMDAEIFGLDCYTYAARKDWAHRYYYQEEQCRFDTINCDLRHPGAVTSAISRIKPDLVFHLAAESHVCNSITGPRAFAETNFMGTFNLLEALRGSQFSGKFVHVSTDETFGELKPFDQPFSERTMLQPRSPYSASKAASDLIVQAYVHTYGLNASITRCTNNYGPNQHEEKLIPRSILRFSQGEHMTVYGTGKNTRDWIYVEDHCEALLTVAERGEPGEIYCIGSGLEMSNIDVIIKVAETLGHTPRVQFTDDRPTDDTRYAVDTSKIQRLGWKPNSSEHYFEQRLAQTVQWYNSHGSLK